jgi:hypothetical protein
MALTSLPRWPSPPRLWISLATSRSCIIHRRMGAVPPNSCSFPCANLWLADRRIPASFRHADAQTTLSSGMLCILVFSGSPRSFRLRVLTPLFAFAGVCDGGRPPRARVVAAAEHVHAPNSAAAATSLLASLAAPAHIVCLSIEVDKNAGADANAVLSKMEKRGDGDGNADGDGVSARR